MDYKAGRRIGSFVLEAPLGSGGNGHVWRATGPEGVVAIKVLHARHARPGDARYKRFRHEVEILKRLGGRPGVLPVITWSLPESPTPADPAWLAMPVAEGMVDALGPNPTLSLVVEAVAAIAETLAGLHAQWVAHRDLKPGNLYRFAGRWTLGDFGLVEFPDKEALTATGERLGPANYIAPEMLLSAKEADGRAADVYSLLKTLYVLAARQPYAPPGQQLVTYRPYTLETLLGDARALHLDRLIERGTDPDPARRPTMAEVVAELRAWLAGPPGPPEPAGDHSDLAARVLRVMAARRDEQERQQHLTKTALKETWGPLSEWVYGTAEAINRSPAGSAFVACPTERGVIGAIFGPETYEPAWPTVFQGSLEVRVEGPTGPAIQLASGFAIGVFDNTWIRLCCAHVLVTPAWRDHPEILWRNRREMRAGSAEAQRTTASLVAELNSNFRPAMERLTETLRSHAAAADSGRGTSTT
jgi:hypothetical protein